MTSFFYHIFVPMPYAGRTNAEQRGCSGGYNGRQQISLLLKYFSSPVLMYYVNVKKRDVLSSNVPEY